MRVVVADDSTLLREGLVRLLEEGGLEVVGQAADGEELLRKVRAHKPDVAVVDVRMPPTHTDEGLRAAREIRAELPEVSILVLSQYVEVAYARELLAESAEGLGYLLKDRVADVAALTDAVRRVGAGGSALDPEVVSQMLGRRRNDGVVEVEITDDGVGGADPDAGTGLRGLEDRVAALDGRLEVRSAAGAGTTVAAVIPCA